MQGHVAPFFWKNVDTLLGTFHGAQGVKDDSINM